MPQPEQFILYDLDQTIIPWDTQWVFRSFVLHRGPFRRFLTPVFLAFLPLHKVEPARPRKHRLAFGMGCARQLFGFWRP